MADRYAVTSPDSRTTLYRTGKATWRRHGRFALSTITRSISDFVADVGVPWKYLPMSKASEPLRHDETEAGDLSDIIRGAMAKEGITHYAMSLVGEDIQAIIDAVNIRIDAHLTACNCPERGDSYVAGSRSITATSDTKYWRKGDRLQLAQTLECRVSAESLPVLLRRLNDCGDDVACGLRSDILSTLGIESD
jgi:hypothetical protein